jgi:hypothetical protein
LGEVKHWEVMEKGNYWHARVPATTVTCRRGYADINS